MANVSSSNTTTLYSTTQQVPIATGAPVATGTVNDANFTTLYGQVTSAPNPNGNQVIQNLLVTGNEQINGNLTVLGTTTLNNTVINGMTWPLADGTNGQVLTTDGAGNLYWSSVSSLLSYTFDAAATTGGADINLTDNSSNVQTVTLLEGTGVTITVPQSDEVEIAIGQDVATTANPQFAGATLGNVTVGVATDNTITTTSGDLVLDSATNQVTIDANATVVGDLAVNGGDITTTSLTPNLWNGTGLTYVLLGPQEWDWTGNTYVYNARATANNTSTNTVATPLYVQRNVSGGGTPAVGVGSSIIYNVETQQTVFVDAAALEIVSTDVTPGSNDFDFKLKLIENGVLGTKLTLTSAGDLTVTGNITGAGTTMGNITVGVVTDNTISTTTGDLNLAANSNIVNVSATTINLSSNTRASITSGTSAPSYPFSVVKSRGSSPMAVLAGAGMNHTITNTAVGDLRGTRTYTEMTNATPGTYGFDYVIANMENGVDTTSNPTEKFRITRNGIARTSSQFELPYWNIASGELVTTTAGTFTLDSWGNTTYTAASYYIVMKEGPGRFRSCRIDIVHDGGTAYMNEHSSVYNDVSYVIGIFNVTISGGQVILEVTPEHGTQTNTFRWYRTATPYIL